MNASETAFRGAMISAVQQLVRLTTGQDKFEDDAFYNKLEEKVQDFDFQKDLAQLIKKLENIAS